MAKKMSAADVSRILGGKIAAGALRALAGEAERRVFQMKELRVDAEGKKIVGHAAVFNTKAEIYGFQERVSPGAFAKSIQESDIRALFNHDANFVLGRNKAGTLELKEDEQGLVDIITPPETTWAKDLMESIRRGDITQQSFGFQTIKDAWCVEDGMSTRTLLEVKLFDVSPVTFPAYSETDCGVRAAGVGAAFYRGLLKLNGGHALDEEELTVLRGHVSDLEDRLRLDAAANRDAKEPGHKSATHSSIDVLRRRLDLAERGI